MWFVRTASLILLLSPAAASAQTMNAELFYKRANALMAKGPMALFARGEIKALSSEGQAAGEAARARRLADKAAGRPPRACPPSGTSSIGRTEFLERLGAIPATERARIDLTEALIRITAAKFPCPR